MKALALATALTAAALLTGCGDSSSTPAPSASTAPAAATWKLDTAPANALDVLAGKEAASNGGATQDVVLRGRVGGRHNPISYESGLFVMMDPAVPSCADMGDEDHCTTPWDYCCEPNDVITKNAVTVQVRVGGKPVTLTADAIGPLDTVVIKGKLAQMPGTNASIVMADGVFVESKFQQKTQ